MLINIFLFGFGVVFILYAVLRKNNRKGKVLTGPKGLPIFGCAFEFNNKTMHLKLMDYAKQFGAICGLKIFNNDLIVLSSEQVIHKAFAGERYRKVFNDRAHTFYGEFFRCGKQSLAFMTDGSGMYHKIARKTYFKTLHVYGSGIQELENNVMIEMSNLVNVISESPGQQFEWVYTLKRSLSNIISLVLKGELLDNMDPDITSFLEHGTRGDFFLHPYINTVLTTFPVLRFLPGQLREKFRRQMYDFGRIEERYFHEVKKTHVPGQVRGIVDVYLDEHRKQLESGSDVFFTDKRIIAQIVETFDAGLMTTWTFLSNAMLVLLNYPEYQRKIQMELERVIGKSGVPSFADRGKCTFFLAFEMEVHRLIPVLPMMLPHLCRSHVEFEGYDIQPNSMIIANIWYVHHNEETWGDPWNFRPERFLDEGSLLPRDHKLCQSVLTFGCGNRQCPGEMFAKTRIFMYMATLLQRWSFEFPPGKEKTCDPRDTDAFELKANLRAKPFHCIAKERQ